jgi:hypothetical protein
MDPTVDACLEHDHTEHSEPWLHRSLQKLAGQLIPDEIPAKRGFYVRNIESKIVGRDHGVTCLAHPLDDPSRVRMMPRGF